MPSIYVLPEMAHTIQSFFFFFFFFSLSLMSTEIRFCGDFGLALRWQLCVD